jgi:hypothetical protein
MFGKKTSAFRSITNSLGLTKAEPSGWQKFKASSAQFWADDKAAVGSWFDTDHSRRIERIQARNTYTVGIAWPGQAKAESSAVGALNWALENPEKVVVAAGLAAGGVAWVVDRFAAGAPKGKP